MGQYDPRVDGYETQYLTADGLVADGQAILLHGAVLFSGVGGASTADFHDDADAATAANRVASLTGSGASVSNTVVGWHVKCSTSCYVNVDANTDAVIVIFRRL